MGDPPAGPSLARRRALLRGLALVALAALGASGLACERMGAFPPDTVPEGAYLRVVGSISQGNPRDCFAYLEDEAQHAAYSIRDYRKQAYERVAATYPEPERTRLLDAYRALASAPDGADVWLDLAQRRGWIGRLRKDLSGIASIETTGDLATIQTARGTRYNFRRRKNGIWGLSMFTAELMADAERAARDGEVVAKAAADYARGK